MDLVLRSPEYVGDLNSHQAELSGHYTVLSGLEVDWVQLQHRHFGQKHTFFSRRSNAGFYICALIFLPCALSTLPHRRVGAMEGIFLKNNYPNGFLSFKRCWKPRFFFVFRENFYIAVTAVTKKYL